MTLPLGSKDTMTPMLRQYREIKEQNKDAILFYRIGDFYEMFFDDAVIASKVLDIVLTSRNKNDPNPVPLCGVPYHSVQPYLEKLIEKGFKVAICDQVEDPKEAKGVVRREVTRVVTPGIAGFLENETSRIGRCLAAVFRGAHRWGLSFLDASTGDFRVTELEGGSVGVLEELQRVAPGEVVIPEGAGELASQCGGLFCVTRLSDWIWEEGYARRLLTGQFKTGTLSGFDCEGIPAGIVAAGAALHYVRETQRVDRLPNITSLKRYRRSETMILSEECRKNLSLDDLITLVDTTRTAMGRRRLREWFHSPLLKKEAIEERLDAVEELPPFVDKIEKTLQDVYDLERINGRLSLGTANARDLAALTTSLNAIGEIGPLLGEFHVASLKRLAADWNSFETLRHEIGRTIALDPPFSLREGGMIREGVDPRLDELRHLQQDAKGALAAMEERERKRTGIGSLKIRFNQVFGYYLEVSEAHLSKVPPDFVRKQTLTHAERFITPELKEFEEKILGAGERIRGLEYDLFCTLRGKILESVPALQEQADRVATLDAVASLARYARENRTVRPVLEESGLLEFCGGRHPVVERSLATGSYVPNDLKVDADGDRLLMITGPNMAGKSTVIRQAGLIVLMAQVGSFVPAERARIGIVDQIFTRVGASDRLARGESTFMVEMCETAAILHQATARSLILLDEIGRGTSTFDGISIAWAVAEHLHDKVRARTLFATHYHELIDLALTRPGIKNFNVRVKQEGEDVVFLYRLVPGGMSHSYGLHVGRLAGLPSEVLDRAKEVLKNLEQGELDPAGVPRIGKRSKKNENQGSLF